MELLLDRTSYFNWFFDWIFVFLNFRLGRGVSSFFCHAKAKLPRKDWTLTFIENIAFTILHRWVMRAPFESTCPPSVAAFYLLRFHGLYWFYNCYHLCYCYPFRTIWNTCILSSLLIFIFIYRSSRNICVAAIMIGMFSLIGSWLALSCYLWSFHYLQYNIVNYS